MNNHCRLPNIATNVMKHRVVLHRVPFQNIDTVRYIARQCVPLGFRVSRVLRIKHKPCSDTITIAECPDIEDANDICRCFIENGIEAMVVPIPDRVS